MGAASQCVGKQLYMCARAAGADWSASVEARARCPLASYASNSKVADSPPRQRVNSTTRRARPTSGTGRCVEGNALTRQVVGAPPQPALDSSLGLARQGLALPRLLLVGFRRAGASPAHLPNLPSQIETQSPRRSGIGRASVSWTIDGEMAHSMHRLTESSCSITSEQLMSAGIGGAMTQRLAGKRILIVEDEQMLVGYLADAMAAEGLRL
jgi:hypothetical protein